LNGDNKPDILFTTAKGLGLASNGGFGQLAAALHTASSQASGSPSASGTSPGFGTGSSQTFTFTFSDPAGYQNLSVVDVLISNALDGRHACYIALVPSGPNSGSVYLVDDAGDAGGPYQWLVLPGGGSVNNGQCTVNGSSSSVSGSGNTLTLVLSLGFSSAFGGNKVVYTSAQDKAGGNSGWQALGTWSVPTTAVSGPGVGGVVPAHTTGSSATYTFTFTDTSGWQDIGVVNILINKAIDGRNACYLALVPSGPSSASVYLVDDAGDAAGPYAGTVLPGSGTVSNSQCTAGGAGSVVNGSGNTLTVTLPISFNSAFSGNRVVYLAARNNGRNSDWQAMGTVSVP